MMMKQSDRKPPQPVERAEVLVDAQHHAPARAAVGAVCVAVARARVLVEADAPVPAAPAAHQHPPQIDEPPRVLLAVLYGDARGRGPGAAGPPQHGGTSTGRSPQ